MALDKRVPAVYVEIEDRSLSTPTMEAGRSGYVVILSDRGPHNKVVELNSREDLYDIFGKPDFMRYGQAHYLADKFLTYSSRLYVVRPCLLDTEFTAMTNEEDCMAISNSYIKKNTVPEGVTEITGNFTFTEESNIVSVLDSTSLVNVAIGDWVYPESAEETEMRQIVAIDIDDLEITLDSNYLGATVTENLDIFVPFEIETLENMRGEENLDTQATDVLWYFHAIGAGAYYNNIFIKAVRNVELEKMFTDEDGHPTFPNMFMDISIYRRNDDNTISMLEGPWQVSLVDRIPGGQLVRDIFTGKQLFMPTVINENSKILKCVEGVGASSLMTISLSGSVSYPYEPDNSNRLAVQTLFSEGNLLGLNTVGAGGFFMESGENGSLFTEAGLLNYNGNTDYEAMVTQSYNGSLSSVDGSVELIVQEIYPWYIFDYVLSGGYGVMEQNAARILCDLRNDCLLLADTGANNTSPDDDLDARLNDVPWNTWNAALYVQYREIADPNTGKRFWITPVYHAVENHLIVDSKYWIAEPVAGIEKGAIQESIELAYKANITKLGDMIEAEMNPVIVEPDGVYILTQFSTWKRLSVMKRLHVVKFVQFLKKRIPTLLKDILQRKASAYWINQCSMRVNGLLNTFLETASSERYIALKSFSAVINFDDVRSEINCTLTITPIRAIERIHVNIIVT